MFILRDLFAPLQSAFSSTPLGRERAQWFLSTLLAVIVPFTSSMTSNLLRTLTTLFGLSLSQRRFYTFMASPTLPWDRLWQVLWGLIPAPLTDGRLVLALDDFINPKVGRKIFGCAAIFDHAAKSNQSQYPWAQNVVMVGLLKQIKDRWACLPLAFRFYLPKKAIDVQTLNVKKGGKVPPFQTKLAQASAMIINIASHYAGVPVLVVTDSWFGNNGLFKPVREALGLQFHLLSRLRVSSMLYGLAPERTPNQRGATRKYGGEARFGGRAGGRISRSGPTLPSPSLRTIPPSAGLSAGLHGQDLEVSGKRRLGLPQDPVGGVVHDRSAPQRRADHHALWRAVEN